MSYDVGTHIDLTQLNKPKVADEYGPTKLSVTTRNFMDVGTQISFRYINKQLKGVRRIPVAFA